MRARRASLRAIDSAACALALAVGCAPAQREHDVRSDPPTTQPGPAAQPETSVIEPEPSATQPEPSATEPAAPATQPEPPWTLVYSDGAANVSRLGRASAEAQVSFQYVPITPERSSTGTYSGGAPRQAQLAPDDARIAAIWREVERLEADPSVHAASRDKGTGAFTITTPAGERAFIIRRGPALAEIERLLAGLGRPSVSQDP